MAERRADGAAGARRAAALLGISACAEATHTSLDGDYAKVDMKLSFRDAFTPSQLLTVHAQVKSGRSFRSRASSVDQLTLKIDHETLAALSGSALAGMVVWVPPAPGDRLYWYASDPRAPRKTPVKISRLQYIRPSIRYDLSRICRYSNWSKGFARQGISDIDGSAVMTRAKQAYSVLKAKEWFHPLVGRLSVTRLAWRHITRRSRSSKQRIQALRIVPYLKTFLDHTPDRFVCNHATITEFGRWSKEVRHILCWYRGAFDIGGASHSLLVRIKEEIRYPTDWQRLPLGMEDITQKATLESWWCKLDD